MRWIFLLQFSYIGVCSWFGSVKNLLIIHSINYCSWRQCDFLFRTLFPCFGHRVESVDLARLQEIWFGRCHTGCHQCFLDLWKVSSENLWPCNLAANRPYQLLAWDSMISTIPPTITWNRWRNCAHFCLISPIMLLNFVSFWPFH